MLIRAAKSIVKSLCLFTFEVIEGVPMGMRIGNEIAWFKHGDMLESMIDSNWTEKSIQQARFKCVKTKTRTSEDGTSVSYDQVHYEFCLHSFWGELRPNGAFILEGFHAFDRPMY